MDVIPVRLSPNTTRRLLERLRGSDLSWDLRSGGDACHPTTRLVPDKIELMRQQASCTPVVMERPDFADLDVDQARYEAGNMIDLVLDPSRRQHREGIGARQFLGALRIMAQQIGRSLDVHARGPWLPVRICVKDAGPPPFGPATLAAWNQACAPGLQVTNNLRNRTTVIGSPQSVHASPDTWPVCQPIDAMRTIGLLENLVVD